MQSSNCRACLRSFLLSCCTAAGQPSQGEDESHVRSHASYRVCGSVPVPLNRDAHGTGFQVIDSRQRHARAHEQPEEPAEAFPEQHPSQDMDALAEPHSSAEEDAHMPEAGSPQQPRPHEAAAQHSRQHSSASAGFAADFGDTATSFDGEQLI